MLGEHSFINLVLAHYKEKSMYENDFDSFVSQVLGGNNGLPVKSASQDQPAPQAMFSADQAEAAARAALSAEEAQMAEYLGQLEAENTVKQANFIGGFGMDASKQANALLESGKAILGAGKSYAEMAAEAIHSGAGSTGRTIFDKLPGAVQDIVGRAGTTPEQLGYGVPAAAALGAAGLGYGAHKLLASRRAAKAMAMAPIEQSFGRKVLQHLAKHKVGYGVGAAGLAGLGALGAYKSASQDEILWEKAASAGEAFLDQLASAALGDATTQELALFREAALSHLYRGVQ